MGNILSWFRGPPNDNPALQDVTIEEQSQPKQAAAVPAAQVSLKPAQYETTPASASAPKPTGTQAGTKTAGGVSASVATPGSGGASAAGGADAQKGSPKATTTERADLQAKLVSPSPYVPPSPKGSPEDVPKTSTTDKVAPAPTATTKPQTTPAQDTLKSSSTSQSAKMDAPAASKPAAAAAAAASKGGVSTDTKAKEAKPSDTKVQREVAPPQAKTSAPALDPLDALANTLPSESLKPKTPVYTGPEVKEPGLTKEKGVICGEREVTIPPGYRKEDLEKKAPAPKAEVKPKEVVKPLSTDEALDSLSAGFMSSAPPAPPKKETTSSTAKVAPAPTASSKPQTTPAQDTLKSSSTSQSAKMDAPAASKPAAAAAAAASKGGVSTDTKAKEAKPSDTKKVEDIAAIDALSAGFSNFAPPPPVSTKSPAPPADKKPKIEKGGSMSLDALGALGDTLAAPEPTPEPPKLRPEDIVSEGKMKSEKGVRVGEREDSLPPKYRFKEEDLMKYPAPEPEPSMDPNEALDVLSGDFMTSSSAPAVHASVVMPTAPPQPADIDELTALDTLAGDFVAPAVAPAKISAPAPPPSAPKAPVAPCAPKAPAVPETNEGGSMSLDALSALGDTLAAADPTPEPPKLRPEDIVSEGKVKSEKGVRVGEREDSLPPEYRFKEEDLMNYPAPEPEPSMDPTDALDVLSGDFMTSSSATAVQAPTVSYFEPPRMIACTFGWEPPADLIDPAVAPAAVHSSVCTPAERQLSSGTCDALDALSDTLMDTTPAPAPASVSAKDVIKEKTIEEEKLIKMGERDDSLPPEFRPSEKDLKAVPKVQPDVRPKQMSIDDTTALDLLSSDFSSVPVAPAPPPAADSLKLTVPVESPLVPAPAPVLDALADTLIPQAVAEVKPKEPKSKVSQEVKLSDTTPVGESTQVHAKSGKSKSKSKKQAPEESSAMDLLSDQLTTEVVSTKKGGKS